jgi:Carboxypeptidase regulatory-like domain
MKRPAALILSGTMIAACGGPTSPTSPTPGVGISGAFALSGVVREVDGSPIGGASLQIQSTSFETRTTMSAQSGAYRFDGIAGMVVLRAVKDGYDVATTTVSVAADQVADVNMQRIARLVAGEVFRGIINDPPCNPSGWDARAPCRRIFYTPTTNGTLTLRVTWTGSSEVDLLMAGGYWEPDRHEIRATMEVQSGLEYEIILNSYYAPVPFEITAELLPK